MELLYCNNLVTMVTLVMHPFTHNLCIEFVVVVVVYVCVNISIFKLFGIKPMMSVLMVG